MRRDREIHKADTLSEPGPHQAGVGAGWGGKEIQGTVVCSNDGSPKCQ